MQLDRTRIAIRERGVLDTLDLSLHVLRAYALPLLVTTAIGTIPLMALNHVLLGWMTETVDNELDYPFRFVWNMIVLVVIEAPLASVFATAYLGDAVFLERPRLRKVVAEVTRMFPRIAWCQILVRGIGAAWLLYLSVDRFGDFDFFLEGFVLTLLLVYVIGIRAVRPFINEIVLLERNPLVSRHKGAMTVGRRSAMLHGAGGGEPVLRWAASAMIGIPLALALYGTCLFLSGVFLNRWSQGPVMVQFCLPLSLWLAAGYVTVFRFLSYLDARIRQEGWEVELCLRAEAARITGQAT